MKVPWAKLYMDAAEAEMVSEVLTSNWVSMGPRVQEFEKKMAAYVGVRYAVAVNSGTAALDTALKCLAVTADDEVILPAFTYIATANAVLYQHATPIFADITPDTFNLDAEDVAAKVTKRTKCIIAIDYGGHAADFDRLRRIGKDYGIPVLEDGAPGLGGEYHGRKNCSLGDISITSFHTAKTFTTVEGGMVFTDDPSLAEKARIIRSQGEDPHQKYTHPIVGHNYRMTDINAAIGLVQISRADEVLAARDNAARYYLSKLEGRQHIVVPHVKPNTKHAWFLFPILVKKRDTVKYLLSQQGIDTNVSWPQPVYNQKPYGIFKQRVCPVSEEIARCILCLPLFYKISKEEQDYVIDQLLIAVDHA